MSFRRLVAGTALALVLVGCTDWDQAPGAAPGLLGVVRPEAVGTAGPGVVAVDTWRAPGFDATTAGADVPPTSFDVAIVQGDAGNALVDGGYSSSDVGTGGAIDSETQSDTTDAAGEADAATSDATGSDAIGFDTIEQDVVQPDAGEQDSAAVDVGQPDAAPIDAVQPDAGPPDVSQPDVSEPDVSQPDAGPADAGTPDAGPVDAGTPDAGTPDAGTPDAGTPDAGTPDALVDSSPSDAGPADTSLSDVVVDAGMPDTASDAPTTLPDAGWTQDWGGYPDASWPTDVDIYGGVITSCFNAYAYVFQEACTGNNLTNACVDEAAKDASLYTQFLFQPLRECAQQNCVASCTGPDSFACMEKCLGKNCPYPLFACIAQGETGGNDCPSTFSCLSSYEDKIFSIATKCFANATAPAQQQLATFFGCGQVPQTESCFEPIAACYGSGNNDCLETIKCTSACKEGDDVCGFQCLGQATPAAQQQLDLLWDCIYSKCSDCSGPDGCGETCHKKKCLKEQQVCILNSN